MYVYIFKYIVIRYKYVYEYICIYTYVYCIKGKPKPTVLRLLSLPVGWGSERENYARVNSSILSRPLTNSYT